MALAGQSISPQGESGEGKFDVHLKASTGDDFIIEIKYLRDSDLGKLPGNDKAKEIAIIQEAIEKLAKNAMAQIEEKKYDLKFKGAGNSIYKVALVVNERTNVKIFLKKADNWVLEKIGQIYKVAKT
jgi:hypothetical protein